MTSLVFFRCGKCLTKNWCSRDCQLKDWEEKHQEFCNSAADERKVKGGAKVRAKSEMEKVEETFKSVSLRRELREEALQKRITYETFDQFCARVVKTMEKYPVETINKTIESMDQRMGMIIDGQGHRTKY